MDSLDGRFDIHDVFDESLCEKADIEFAIAFGSQIQGTATPTSDLDIAVKFSEDLSASERFQKRCFLAGELQDPDCPRVDIVDIESLPIDVAHDAIGGELICGDRSDFERFRSRVEAQFESERDRIRREHRETIDRIAEEGLRG